VRSKRNAAPKTGVAFLFFWKYKGGIASTAEISYFATPPFYIKE